LSELAALAIGPEQAAVAAAGVVRYVEVASAQESARLSKFPLARRQKMRKGQLMC
jgi:hypothetical protein